MSGESHLFVWRPFFFLRFRRRERKTRHTARCDERSWLRHSRQQYVTWHRRDACLLRLLHRRLSTEVVFVKCILACASFIRPRPVFAFFWQPRWALRRVFVGREAYRDDTTCFAHLRGSSCGGRFAAHVFFWRASAAKLVLGEAWGSGGHHVGMIAEGPSSELPDWTVRCKHAVTRAQWNVV